MYPPILQNQTIQSQIRPGTANLRGGGGDTWGSVGGRAQIGLHQSRLKGAHPVANHQSSIINHQSASPRTSRQPLLLDPRQRLVITAPLQVMPQLRVNRHRHLPLQLQNPLRRRPQLRQVPARIPLPQRAIPYHRQPPSQRRHQFGSQKLLLHNGNSPARSAPCPDRSGPAANQSVPPSFTPHF